MNNSLQNRRHVILGFMLFIILAFLIKIFTLQISTDYWADRATSLTQSDIPLQPSRGELLDRNGKILVENTPTYDIMIIPEQLIDLDTIGLINLLQISKKDLISAIKIAANRRALFNPQKLVSYVSQDQFLTISEKLNNFNGVYGVRRSLRHYPDSAAALVLGNLSEITQKGLEQDSLDIYDIGDYLGSAGIEKFYEEQLRGVKGSKTNIVNNVNKVVGSTASENSKEPISGNDIILSIDSELQKLGESLMVNKRGAIVAIEPSSGEILALVNAPTFDPNSLVGSKRSSGFAALKNDTLDPLYNRATKGLYRPGSIFKMIQSLIALEAGIITPRTRIKCNRSIIGCHGPHTNDDLENAIKHSCNPYFRQVMRRMVLQKKDDNEFEDLKIGVQWWHERIKKFGLHTRLATDFSAVKRGTVPDTSFYNRWYPKAKWTYSMIYSVSIGEGELQVNPLQMANLAAIIANKGWYITPHLVKQIEGEESIPEEYLTKKSVEVSSEHFDVVQRAMERVINEPGGTAGRANLSHLGITVCGKTGTVQNEPPIEDHSVFMCFAPKENPKIALAVYVENAGFGGTWAAPISALMIEQYLNGEISNDWSVERILNADFRDRYGE